MAPCGKMSERKEDTAYTGTMKMMRTMNLCGTRRRIRRHAGSFRGNGTTARAHGRTTEDNGHLKDRLRVVLQVVHDLRMGDRSWLGHLVRWVELVGEGWRGATEYMSNAANGLPARWLARLLSSPRDRRRCMSQHSAT